MKKWLKAAAAAVAMALGGCATAAPGASAAVELFAVSVGKGDALLVRVDDYACLIDAGKARAMGRIRAAMDYLGIEALDAVFLTHPDDDHAGGLEWLAASDIPVGAWYASALFTEVKADKHPAAQAAEARGESVVWLRRGDRVALGDGAAFEVLAPETLFTDKDDNNSLVMMLESDAGRVLFTGDMELPQEAVLLDAGDDLRCAVLKAPNHGDNDTLSGEFARAASAQAAIISTDSYEKPGTPDPGVLARLADAGSAVYVTQDAELGLCVTLSDGQASVEAVDIPDAPVQDVAIRRIVPGDDLIEIVSHGVSRDLTGWSLHSERGDELYRFPDGFVLAAGGGVTIGTRSSDEGSYDLLWDDKKVIHKSKTDVVTLYDAWGRPVDAADNGL